MKKNYILYAAALSIAVLASSCQKENELTPSENNGKVSVIVSLGDETKGFTDAEGVTWEVGDQIKYAGGVELTSDPLTEEQISDNGYTASFTFDASLIETDRTGWFVSTKCHPSNYTEVEFTLGADNGNLITQDEAGKMNSRYLFLHSGTTTTTITKDVEPVVKMDIAGSIFRVIPYTTTYNDEQVLSVKFESNDKVVGTVGYDRGAGTYKSVTDVNWKTYTYVKVDLGTPFSLTGVTSAENSKGIYLPVAATKADAPLTGYKYVVETDKATYTFDAMDKTLAVGENAVKNVYLNLDKGTRVEGETGYLKYDGALTLSIVPAAGCTDQDAGYWKALVSTNGTDYVDRINAENAVFYSNVQFTYTDATTGDPVDWISVKYGGSDLCHWLVTAQENTGEERSVKVTATYSDVKGYAILEEYKIKALTITQSSASAKKVVEYASASLPASREFESGAQTNVDVGYCLLKIDGAEMRDWKDANSIYARSHFAYVSEENYAAKNYTTDVDWLSCVYANDGTYITDCRWLVSATENTGSERVAYVVCVFPEDEGYSFPEPYALKVTQKAGYAVVATLSGVYAETVPAAGGDITAATLALTVNGTAQEDVAAALSTYGISVSADKGATASVAADGTVTLTVPENKYKNGGVTYTLTVKTSSNTTLASATINQAEGTEEAVTPAHTFSYTIFNNAANGSKATEFGSAAGSVGDWYRIENVVIDGVTYNPGEDLKNLVTNTELMTALQNQIFSFGEITAEDVQVPDSDPLTTNPESFVKLEAWTDGGAAIYFRIVFLNTNDTGVRRTFKIITKDADGNVTSTIVYFQNA
ncbi:MAG: hypothetical protein ACI4TL_03155 [Candidatus Cryptobacteroides sp.]